MIFIYLCALSTLIVNEESFRPIRAQTRSHRGVATNILSKGSRRTSLKGLGAQNLPRNTEECLARCQQQEMPAELCAAACTGSTQSECETSVDAYLNPPQTNYKLTYTATDGVVETVTVSYTETTETLGSEGLDIPAGTAVTLTVTAKSGKKITGITPDPSTTTVSEVSGSENTYTFTMPSSALTLVIAGEEESASEDTYTVSWDTIAHIAVSVSVDGGQINNGDKVAAGKTVSVTLTPETGYSVSSAAYKVSGEDEGKALIHTAGDVYTFEMPDNSVMLTIEAQASSPDPSQAYKLTYTATDGVVQKVTVSYTEQTDVELGSEGLGIPAGTEVTLKVTAASGKKITEITSDPDSTTVSEPAVSGSVYTYTFTMPSSALTLTIVGGDESASEDTYTVTWTLPSGDTTTTVEVSDSQPGTETSVTVAKAATVQITITPGTNKRITALTVAGETPSEFTSGTESPITFSHTVTADTEITITTVDVYTITATYNTAVFDCSITPTGTVEAGQSVTVELTVKEGADEPSSVAITHNTAADSVETATEDKDLAEKKCLFTFTVPARDVNIEAKGKYTLTWETVTGTTVKVGGEVWKSGDAVAEDTEVVIGAEASHTITKVTKKKSEEDSNPETITGTDNVYTFTMPANSVILIIEAAEGTAHRSNDVSPIASHICAAIYSDDDDDDSECDADTIAAEKKRYEADFPDYIAWYQKMCDCLSKAKEGGKEECKDNLHGLTVLKYPVNDGQGKGYYCGVGIVKFNKEKFGDKDQGITATGTSLILTKCEFTEVESSDKDSVCISAETLADDQDKVVSAGYLGVSECTFTKCAVEYIIFSATETTIRYCIFDQCTPSGTTVSLRTEYECSVSNSNFTQCQSPYSDGVAIKASTTNKLTVAKCYFHNCVASYDPVSIRVSIEKQSTSARSNADQIGSFVLTDSAFDGNSATTSTAGADVEIEKDPSVTDEELKKAVTVSGVTTEDKTAALLIQVNGQSQIEGVKQEAASGLDEDAGFGLKNVEANSGNPEDDDGDGFPAWAIVLIVVGGVAIIAAVVVVVVIVMRKKSHNKVSPDTQTFTVDTDTGNATEMN